MLFSSIQMVSVVALTGMNYFFCRKNGARRIKAFILSSFNAFICWLMIFFLSWACNDFVGFGTQNAVRAFCTLPLLIWIQTKIFDLDFRQLNDRYAVAPLLTYGIAHYACIFSGCCHGFEYAEGTLAYDIAQKLTGTNMLPQQFIEATCSLITTLIIFIIFQKKKGNAGGRLMFIMLVAYGTQRFLFEFLRDNEKLIVIKEMAGAYKHTSSSHIPGYWGISELALWSLAMVIVGVAFLIALHVKDKKAKATEAVTA